MKILGFTESITTCSCGKTNLKGTYVVETENGETLNLGSTCVKNNWDLTQKEFRNKVNEAKKERIQARYNFMKQFETKTIEIKDKHNVGIYDHGKEGYDEFMKAYKQEIAATEEMNRVLPFIKD